MSPTDPSITPSQQLISTVKTIKDIAISQSLNHLPTFIVDTLFNALLSSAFQPEFDTSATSSARHLRVWFKSYR